MPVATDPSVPATAIAAAARRLTIAAASGQPVQPVRDLVGRDDVRAAYAVQHLLTEQRTSAGARVVGRKIGLTSLAVQQQLGVDRPDFGVLFDDMEVLDGGVVPVGTVMQPRVEAEVAFVLGQDLVDGDLAVSDVAAGVDHCRAALEICGSRIRDWDISFGDTVADNASGGAYVLGGPRVPLQDVDTASVEMSMRIDGTEVSTGSGAACLGGPLNALQWLARLARDLGDPLRAGQVVLSGALGPMRAVSPGAQVQASITGLGDVSVSFAATTEEGR